MPYVVVPVGVIVIEPFKFTLPIPNIVTCVAFLEDQLRTIDCPLIIVVGLAVIEEVGGELELLVTVIVTFELVVPPFPMAVNVYVVVLCGLTLIDP